MKKKVIELTNCLMNIQDNECPAGKKRRNLAETLCAKHLKQYFGLEMGVIETENETGYDGTGGFLRPAPGVIFKKNTVIIPHQKFFDAILRPEDLATTFNTEEYVLNPEIVKTVNEITSMQNETLKKQFRYIIEMYRNMNEALNSNTGPRNIQEKLIGTLSTTIDARKKLSESAIDKLPTLSQFNNNFVRLHNESVALLNSLPMSPIMKHIMCNCFYALQAINVKHKVFYDGLHYNVKYKQHYGLIATETISFPNFIVIDGVCGTSQAFNNAVLFTIGKHIEGKRKREDEYPEPNKTSKMLRNEDCYHLKKKC